ncbi:hypothetical protein Tco_1281780 [Tanacetum coccineum]
MRARATCGHECSSGGSPTRLSFCYQFCCKVQDGQHSQTPPTVVNTTVTRFTNAVANHCCENQEKFNGQNFKEVATGDVLLSHHILGALSAKEMSVEDLVVRLRIEEDNKLAQKDTYTPDSAKANMVEHVGSSSKLVTRGLAKTVDQPGQRAAANLARCRSGIDSKAVKCTNTAVFGGLDYWGNVMCVLIRIPSKEKEEHSYDLWMEEKPSYHTYECGLVRPKGVAIRGIQGLLDVNVLDDRYPTVIERYSDANWISDIKDFRKND